MSILMSIFKSSYHSVNLHYCDHTFYMLEMVRPEDVLEGKKGGNG